jgi:hypothetical protein
MYEELIKRLRDSEHEIDCSICDRDCCYPDGKVHGKCIIIEAADAIEELQKAVYFHKYNSEFWEDKYNSLVDEKWIPVTERLPEYDSVVLVTDGEDVGTGYRYTLGVIGFTGWAVPFADIEEDDVSHWMPLPEPPKEVT